MNTMTTTFSKYWGDYQDTWDTEYWDVYNRFRQIDDKEMFNNLNKKHLMATEASFIEGQTERMQDGKNGEKVLYNSKSNIKDRGCSPSTHDETANMTMVNLNKIDDEIDRMNEFSVCKDKQKEEKKRGCLDCIVF